MEVKILKQTTAMDWKIKGTGVCLIIIHKLAGTLLVIL